MKTCLNFCSPLNADSSFRLYPLGRKSGNSSGNSTGSEGSSSSSLSSTSKWKATFSPISDPKQPNSELRQGGSPFGMGGSSRSTDSDSDYKQHHQQVRKGSDGESSSYMTSNPFLSQEAGTRGGGSSGSGGAQAGSATDQRQALQKQKAPRDWELKASSSMASQNLFISAATSSGGGILSGKVGGSAVAVSSTTGSSVGQYLGPQFQLGGASVLQSLFGAQTGSSTVSGTPRLVNGHSAMGSFSSAGLAGGAAGGEHLWWFILNVNSYLILRIIEQLKWGLKKKTRVNGPSDSQVGEGPMPLSLCWPVASLPHGLTAWVLQWKTPLENAALKRINA